MAYIKTEYLMKHQTLQQSEKVNVISPTKSYKNIYEGNVPDSFFPIHTSTKTGSILLKQDYQECVDLF